MKIIEVKIEEIKPYANNAKEHTPKQIKLVAESIQRFGFLQPCVLDKNKEIIIGHCRYEAGKLLQLKTVPSVMADNLTDQEIIALRLADNKLNESAWNMELAVPELKLLDPDLFTITGFDSDLLIDLDDKDDEVPEAPAVTKTGDLYEIGTHRILCSDSTKPEELEKLMKGNKADMVFTDPPYNVDYKGSGKNTKNGIMNDKMSDNAFLAFLNATFQTLKDVIKQGAGCYVFHSHKTASTFEKALIDNGFLIDTQLIWNKPSAGMGMNHYRTKHEPFFYCSLSKEKKFYGDRTGTSVWKIPEDPLRAFKWFQREVTSQESGKTTVWTMKRANVAEYVHPTQKPVELAVVAITKSSKEGDIILDQFLGSGTTLIAAEKAGRSCYGLELDPKFCDVVVQRWVNFTGIEKVIKNGKAIIWEKTK